ncbi:MAG TPA: hypothetical protein VNJ01_15975 [Bacteriovoracaceae bacterium]|nr:hypothetical protein [Bacteriovoracaceae bacterium]
MKKILTLSPSKIFIFCGLGLVLTLGAFWHHQNNQQQLDKMSVLNQGVSTCFNRISQTFTAMMIKDIKSPYLDRGFMGLSDECVNETIKGVNPFRKNIGKGYETLNQLISEVHWFHEKVGKLHEPMLKDQNLGASLSPLSNRFSKMEGFKVALVDEIDASSALIREVQINDEFLMGAGLIIFVLSVSLLSLQEYHRIQMQRDIEKNAINLLRSGNANVGSIVDQLVDRALVTQGMPVTAQIFKDYHEDLLEHSGDGRTHRDQRTETETETVETVRSPAKTLAIAAAPQVAVTAAATPVEARETTTLSPRASLKEALISVQNVQPKDLLQTTDVRDVQLAVDPESFEQMMTAAINQLALRRSDGKKIQISNQIHSDRSVINVFLAGATFSATELEFCSGPATVSMDGIDMNMILLKEMSREADTTLNIENKVDRQGRISGMNIRFIVGRAPKESKAKNLVSVVKGKKRDLTRELLN